MSVSGFYLYLILCSPLRHEKIKDVYIPEPEHPEDLVPAEDEAPTPLLPPFFLSPRIRPLSPRALEVEMRDVASAYYHSLHPSGTPPLLPIPLPAPSTSRRADIPEADTPPRKRLLLTTPRPGCEIGESSAAAAARQPGPTIETRLRDTERRMMTALELVNRRVTYQVDVCTRESSEFCTRHHDAQKDRAAVRAEIEVLRRERLAYEQESIQTRQDLARSEAHCRALEARVTVLETDARRHEWQRQAADDLAVQHIMRTQALEAGARVDTLEDTGDLIRVAREVQPFNGFHDNCQCQTSVFQGPKNLDRAWDWFFELNPMCSTWWNSHVMTVTHDVAYSMTWVDFLGLKMTDQNVPEEADKLKGLRRLVYSDIDPWKHRWLQTIRPCMRLLKLATDHRIDGQESQYHGGKAKLKYQCGSLKTTSEAIRSFNNNNKIRGNKNTDRRPYHCWIGIQCGVVVQVPLPEGMSRLEEQTTKDPLVIKWGMTGLRDEGCMWLENAGANPD
ncbi:hypothetical protein Tco_0360947 [Tanacetum coccineum]